MMKSFLFIPFLSILFLSACSNHKPEISAKTIEPIAIYPLDSLFIYPKSITNIQTIIYFSDKNGAFTNIDTADVSHNLFLSTLLSTKIELESKDNASNVDFIRKSKEYDYLSQKMVQSKKQKCSINEFCYELNELNDKLFFKNIDALNNYSEFIFNANTSPFTNGWCKQEYNKQIFYWSFFETHDSTQIIICVPDKNITAYFQLNDSILQNKFDFIKGDILRFLPSILLLNTSERNTINNTFEEFISKALIDENLLNKIEIKQFNQSLLDYHDLLKPSFCEITNVKNNQHSSRVFEQKENGNIQLIGFGEGIKIPYPPTSFEYEHVDLIFNMNNDKKGKIDVKNQNYMYSFYLGLDYCTGNFYSSKNIDFKYKIVDDHNYTLELKIPWTTLNTQLSSILNHGIGFDMSISDNDGFGRESILFWKSKIIYLGDDLSQIGSINFDNTNTSDCFSNRIEAKNILIDGLNDEAWNNASWQNISSNVLGVLNSKEDLVSRFKSLHDTENIYFLVEIKDDKIILNNNDVMKMRDYALIKNNTTGDVVWKMDMENTIPFTGNIRFINKSLFLEKGEYTLHYISNESIAANDWKYTQQTPLFYGIKLLKK